MALERIGIGGVLTFNAGQAVQASGQARDAFGRFQRQADQIPPSMARLGQSVKSAMSQMSAGVSKIGAGIKQMGSGLAQTALGFAPLTAAVGAGINTAAKFEQQMDGVAAITRASGTDMERLTDLAKKMGIESVFSATQAGEAMEYMGRAGATTDQIIGGLPGVMNAAAAESIDLATASDIIAQTTKIMGREWEQASNTADILALTSAKTNTNMIALGESLKYGGQVAANMGYSLEETSATLGLLANAGLRGSIGGTSLVNMFNKLNKPSKKGAEYIKKWNISLTNADGSMRSVSDIVAQFSKRIDKIPDQAEKAGVTTEIFGIRGQRAFQALSKAGPEALNDLQKALENASAGEGAAAEAAKKRLDNFLGALTLFKSSVESVAIGLFGPMLKGFQGTIETITNNLNAVLFALQDIDKIWGDLGATAEDAMAIEKKHGKTATQIALGIKDAIEAVKGAWDTITTAVQAAANVMKQTFGEGTMRSITKWAVIIGVAAAAIAPLLLAMVTVGFAISGLITFFSGLATVASGVFSIISGAATLLAGLISGPVLIAVGALTAAFFIIRREGESFGDTMRRVWGYIHDGAMWVYNNAIMPFVNGFMAAWNELSGEITSVWNESLGMVMEALSFAKQEILAVFAEVFAVFSEGTNESAFDWVEFGKNVASVVATVAVTVIKVMGYIVAGIALAVATLVRILKYPWMMFAKIARLALDGVMNIMEGNFLTGIAKIGVAIFDLMTMPIRLAIQGIIKLAELIPGVEGKIPEGLKKFAEGGLKEFTFPTPEKQKRAAQIAETAAEKVQEKRIGVQAAPEQKGIMDRITDEMKAITDMKAAEKQAAKEPPKVEATVKVDDKRCVEVNNTLNLDGETVARNQARHKQEIEERAGFKATPWQRRVSLEHGAAPRKAIA